MCVYNDIKSLCHWGGSLHVQDSVSLNHGSIRLYLQFHSRRQLTVVVLRTLLHRAELPWFGAEDLRFALCISSTGLASPRQSIDFPYRIAEKTESHTDFCLSPKPLWLLHCQNVCLYIRMSCSNRSGVAFICFFLYLRRLTQEELMTDFS